MADAQTTPVDCDAIHLRKKYPTLVQIKSVIPGTMFESHLPTSLYYIIKDITLMLTLYIVIRYLESGAPWYIAFLCYPAYWLLQGTLMMSLFVLGHDCGHGSFSGYQLLNDCVGTILHTVLLTPYYPWKISHRNHHKNTGNIDKDEVFYPIRTKYHDGKKPSWLLWLGFAWFVYLFQGYKPRGLNHFNPLETMFTNHVAGCTLSVMSLMGWVGCLGYYAYGYGVGGLVLHYVIPEVMFASWLLIVTFLHHTEEAVPWYSDTSWTYVRGQLSSIDRNYGWAHDLVHNIGTHQIHHLFSKIPHYRLEEATTHFRKAYPELVRQRNDPILSAFWRMFQKFYHQSVTTDDAKIHVYR